MDVSVVEPGKQRTTLAVNDFCVLQRKATDIRITAHGDNSVAGNRDGLSKG